MVVEGKGLKQNHTSKAVENANLRRDYRRVHRSQCTREKHRAENHQRKSSGQYNSIMIVIDNTMGLCI